MKEIIGSSVLILGYGAEGQDTHRYLHKFYPEVIVGIADQHNIKLPEDLPAQLFLGEDYLKAVENFETVVRSPGIPVLLPILQKAKESGRNITSATNVFFSECPGTIIGITGTKGKSTTASLAHQVLHQSHDDVRLVGNIGEPALHHLESANRRTVFVAELSSYQLEDIHFSPSIAVILAVVPEHLDHHHGFENYASAKGRIIRYQSPNDVVIFNPSHGVTAKLANQSAAQKFCFSLEPDATSFCWIERGEIYAKGKDEIPKPIISTDKIPLLGEGNLENCMAAITVGILLGVPLEGIRKAITEFQPLEHRLELVGEFQGIKFYDDSIATIPEATIHAIKALEGKVETLILGGFDRGIDYSGLGLFLRQRKEIKTLILFPDTGKKIWQAVCDANPKEKLAINKFEVSSMQEAVAIAFRQTSSGKVCLLSPASASYNLYTNFKERGDEFKRQISCYI